MLRIGVVSLFPDIFKALRIGGITARALERELVSLQCWDPRDYTQDRHLRVDDRPYGGGPGMVMQVEPLQAATAAACNMLAEGAQEGVHRVYLTPQGGRFDQASAVRLAQCEALVLVCGRYEGIDERFIETSVDEELSVGDFVVSGGELPAMLVIEALTRLLPDALGCEDSASEDSFSQGLLDCPHYTRPEEYAGRSVPEVLLSGDHQAIRRWRLKQSLGRTQLRRPDLLSALSLDREQQELLEAFLREQEPGMEN